MLTSAALLPFVKKPILYNGIMIDSKPNSKSDLTQHISLSFLPHQILASLDELD